MELPDFLKFEPFNKLRQDMGTEKLGSFDLVISQHSISREEEQQLESSGVEIESLDDIYELQDGTLAFKDTRVLLYIRDINTGFGHYSRNNNLPKFHLSWCPTLNDMQAQKRFDRYVLSTSTDGVFEVRKVGYSEFTTQTSNIKLEVCKRCLNKLRYDGYSYYSRNKEAIFNNFKLKDFFEKYPKSPLNSKPSPKHSSASAPTDIYPENFNKISKEYREKRNWQCEECTRDFSSLKLRKFLHTHHINGLKYENNDENLKALCIECHAKQPRHSHMRKSPNYIEYMKIKNVY